MKMYCITKKAGTNPTTIKLLQESCDKAGVDFELIEANKYNFAKPLKLAKGSILYQLSSDETSRSIFRTLITDDIATVFKSSRDALDYKDKIATIIHKRAGLPIIKSIFDITTNKSLLREYVDYLDGFPIIIKAQGGSHGVGILRADSFESLASIVDYLKANEPNYFVMRKYIDYKDHARLIVLGNKVVDSIKYHKVDSDFRTNAGRNLRVEPKKFDRSVERIAAEAVAALNAEFGGVDILIDHNGQPHLAEANIPCYFARSQLTTGTNISGTLVNYLKTKAEALA
jgi:glutathione synthase/RimK-type ligase-like ATP-grasp enzyme